MTHFSRCRAAPNCFAVIDSVWRKWIRALLSAEETSTQTQVVFLDALEAENLIGQTQNRRCGARRQRARSVSSRL